MRYFKKGLPSFEDEKVHEVSGRIAARGVFTTREDIPKFSIDKSGAKKITIDGQQLGYNFYGLKENKKEEDNCEALAISDSSYLEESEEKE